MHLSLSLYSTVALSLVFFYLGAIIKKHVRFMRTFCIPTPVIGGLLFAIVNLVLYMNGLLEITMDGTFQELCMVAFFTSVGYSAGFKTILKAGKPVVILSATTGVLICIQNLVGGYLAGFLGLPPVLGVAMGSIPLVGGHGNAGAFGPVIESMGVPGAFTVALSSATFGLVFGSLLGGPVADFLIRRYRLQSQHKKGEELEVELEGEGSKDMMHITENNFISHTLVAVFHIFISMAIGQFVAVWVKETTGVTIPHFLCSMCVAVVIRNISEYMHTYPVYEREGNIVGSISLNIFLALAMMSVKLWELIDLALPMTVILFTNTAVSVAFIILVTFPLMGKSYEVAAMCAGQVGYGLGATPNAMANIAAVEEKYGLAPQARLVIPFVGGLFTSLMNAALITFFINFFA